MSTLTLKITDPLKNGRALAILQTQPETLKYLTVKGSGTMGMTGPAKEMESLQYNIGVLFEEAGFDDYLLTIEKTRTAMDVEADLDALYKTIMRDMMDKTPLARFHKLLELDPKMTIKTAAQYMRGA